MKPRYGLPVFLAICLLGATLTVSGCFSSGALPEPATGSLGYVPGIPNFDLKVTAAPGPVDRGVVVVVGVPPASLVFSRRENAYVGAYERIVRVLDREGSLLQETASFHPVEVEDYESTLTFQPYLHEERIDLPPGSYEIQVVLLDASSEQQHLRSSRVRVPESDEPYLGTPNLTAPDEDEARRLILTSFVPALSESLQVVVPYQFPSGGADDVQLIFLRVERDTTIPNPPYWVMPAYGTLAYRGFSLLQVDTVLVDSRSVAEPTGELVFRLPPVERGLYRLEAIARDGNQGEALGVSTYFVATNASFPRIETLDQMVESLAYVAYEREIGRIQEASNPIERKQRFDAFWGSLVGRRSIAVNLLETYYARIEEANLLYSSYKEGWKTDRGMVYVLLGAPVLVDSYVDSEVWRYSYGDDALYTFVFDRVRIPEADGVYENYILRRRPYYEHVWLQVLDRWRSGVVL